MTCGDSCPLETEHDTNIDSTFFDENMLSEERILSEIVQNDDMKIALTSFHENSGNENMLHEIEKILYIYPEYTNKKWILLDIMRTAYCNGYVGEDQEDILCKYNLDKEDKQLKQLIEFLGNEAFSSGWKDNLKNNYEDNQYTKILEKCLEQRVF